MNVKNMSVAKSLRAVPALNLTARFRSFSFTATLLSALSGCAVMDAMESQIAKWDQEHMAAYPDQRLLATFVGPDTKPAPGYACEPCGFYYKRPEDPLPFLTINRPGPRVHDQAALVAINAAQPIEVTDAGTLFVRNARSRGNAVAVYGAPVNKRILTLSQAKQPPGAKGAWYATDASSCLIEVDPAGAFVSILAVGYELSYGVIRTDVETSKDVFTQQRLFVLPQATARYVQERLGADFRESYRVR